MRTVTVIIPALNEAENIRQVIASVPCDLLAERGWSCEVLVVDNGSEDETVALARAAGASVLVQPIRGYGNAYRAGFANATGDVIATGDADLTYPFDHLPQLLDLLLEQDLDFLTTDRLRYADAEAMKPSHLLGNRVLSQTSRALFGFPFRDSQSGMWIFWRRILDSLDVRSGGMSFSQEIKHEAAVRGFRCGEVPIEYRPRGGEVKLNATRDGIRNLGQLAVHRLRTTRTETSPIILDLSEAYPAEPLEVVSEPAGEPASASVTAERPSPPSAEARSA